MTGPELKAELGITESRFRQYLEEGMPCMWATKPRRRLFDAEAVAKWLVDKGHAKPLPPEESPPAEPFVLKSEVAVAEFFQISVKTFRKYRERGCPGTSAQRGKQDGRFSVPDIRQWIEENVRDVNQSAAPESERNKLERIKRLQAERDLLTDIGALLNADLLQRQLLRSISEAKAQLEMLPAEIIKILPPNLSLEIRMQVRKKVKRKINRVYENLADAMFKQSIELEVEEVKKDNDESHD